MWLLLDIAAPFILHWHTENCGRYSLSSGWVQVIHRGSALTLHHPTCFTGFCRFAFTKFLKLDLRDKCPVRLLPYCSVPSLMNIKPTTQIQFLVHPILLVFQALSYDSNFRGISLLLDHPRSSDSLWGLNKANKWLKEYL